MVHENASWVPGRKGRKMEREKKNKNTRVQQKGGGPMNYKDEMKKADENR
jgi:hypothetical protein